MSAGPDRLPRCLRVGLLAGGLLACGAARGEEAPGAWPGVDETVVARFAEAGGRPPRAPYLDTDQGDLLLFVFLVAGSLGGFAAGYCFRSLFAGKGRR